MHACVFDYFKLNWKNSLLILGSAVRTSVTETLYKESLKIIFDKHKQILEV